MHYCVQPNLLKDWRKIKMNKYLITLTPIDKFFFGGDITFTRSKEENKNKKIQELQGEEAEMKAFDESYSSYVIRSNAFPQQTSLLGMLRYTFLSNDKTLFKGQKILTGKESDVINLIGKESFSVNGDGVFGVIKSISSCFLQRSIDNGKTWTNMTIAPMDHKLSISFEEGKSFFGSKKGKKPEIEGYKAKDGLTPYILDENTELDKRKLFVDDLRIGINRNFEGKTESGAFYKQISFRLSDKYKYKKGNEEIEENHQLRFAFYANLEKSLNEQIISLGGDNSNFKLTCTLDNSHQESVFPKKYNRNNFKNCYGKVFLTSDSLIDQEAMDNCLFSINEIIPFRFLQSKVEETTDYYKFSGGKHLKRSERRYNLHKQGSVFYFDTKEEMDNFISSINSKKCFQQIGYNHFEKHIKENKNDSNNL